MAAPTDPIPATSPTLPSNIPILPDDATPEEKDRHWFQHVYQGDKMPQLTLRAVLMGGILGMLMAASNLYTTLAIGWSFGVAITACVLSFVIWNAFRGIAGNMVARLVVLAGALALCFFAFYSMRPSMERLFAGFAGESSGTLAYAGAAFISLIGFGLVGLLWRSLSQMSVLENACMASTASAAGYSTGATIATMFGALVLLEVIPEGKTAADIKTWDVTAPWLAGVFTLLTGLMGVFLAIPMKRQMINQERLPFPTGTAAAETLRSLYSKSAESIRKAYVLIVGLGAGLLIGFLRVPDEVLEKVTFLHRFFGWFQDKLVSIRIPGDIPMRLADRLYPGGRHPAGLAFEPSALLIAAGMIVGMRTSLSMVVGSAILYGVVAPQIAHIDASHMARGADTVMLAATTAGASATDAATATTATVGAVVKAADELALDSAAIRAAAQAAADDAAKNMPAEVTGAAAAKQIADAVAGATGPLAATQYMNLEATAAAKAAREAAASQGAEEAERAANAAFESKRYKPNFIWAWGGQQIVIMRWALWGGTAVMVFASLTSVALQWRTVARAFTGAKGKAPDAQASAMRDIEVPGMWMVLGMLPITLAMVWLQIQAFGVTWYAGVIAIAMSFVLSMVASRATGETDTTPVGAMGKVMQLIFAVIAKGNITANLASAGIAANSASSSADLLQDLKTGYLLGANPRKQFIAQFCGVFFGTVAIVPIWFLMVPTREKLETFPLPATRSWEAVARVLTKGISELPISAVYAIFIGAAVGIILPVIEKLSPARFRKYLPSASAIGLAWVIPFQNAFSFFVGAVIIMLWTRMHRRTAEQYNVPAASGLIAGESLMAAALAIMATIVGIIESAG